MHFSGSATGAGRAAAPAPFAAFMSPQRR
jgi:hypothetical protein